MLQSFACMTGKGSEEALTCADMLKFTMGRWESGVQATDASREISQRDYHCGAAQDFAKAAMEPVLTLVQEFLVNSSLIRHISIVSGPWQLCFWSRVKKTSKGTLFVEDRYKSL